MRKPIAGWSTTGYTDADQYVICDDGTIWVLTSYPDGKLYWATLPPIPQEAIPK